MTSPKSSAKYVMALDQGTTSSRAILFDGDGRLVEVSQQELPQHVRAHEEKGVDG
ncbi:MAG: hypothetical protein KAT50_06060, partial [Pirellulales bacterium]|nr:hypothetical protein [Pirellulales bacterium]